MIIWLDKVEKQQQNIQKFYYSEWNQPEMEKMVFVKGKRGGGGCWDGGGMEEVGSGRKEVCVGKEGGLYGGVKTGYWGWGEIDWR